MLRNTMVVQVTEPSLLRVWVEGTHVDVDVALRDHNGAYLQSSISIGDEDEIVYVLESGQQYRILIESYHWVHQEGHGDLDPECLDYGLELAIVPVGVVTDRPVCSLMHNTFLPSATDVLPDDQDTAWYFNSEADGGAQYSFPQRADPAVAPHPVHYPPRPSTCSAWSLHYQFAWEALAMRLTDRVAENSTDVEHHHAGKERVRPTRPRDHAPRARRLRARDLREPAWHPTTSAAAQSSRSKLACSRPRRPSRGIAQDDLLGCSYFPPPAELDNLAYLDQTVDEPIHFTQQMLMNVKEREDSIHFHLRTKPYLLRIFVANNDDVDIDIELFSGTTRAAENNLVQASRGYQEETIIARLDPGMYYEVRFVITCAVVRKPTNLIIT